MRPAAVIFDMDGVLVDSERQWRLSEERHVRRLVPGWSDADSSAVVGLGVVELYEYLVERRGYAGPKQGFLDLCDVMAREIYSERVALAPGAREVLAALAARGLAVGLASSSPRPWVELVLGRFSLSFAALATGDETPGRVKPHPDLYLLAAARLGADPRACLAVEDSRHGVRAAKAAGLRCAALRTADNADQDLSEADVELRSLPEVLSEFDTLRP